MQKTKRVHKGLCLALAVLFLVPQGSFAATATDTKAENTVTESELYDAMSSRTGDEAAAREAVQATLARSEVRGIAQHTGLDLKRAQSAVAVLSGDELRQVTDQAQRVDEALAGGGSVVITSTTVIIGLLVLIILLVA